MPTAGGMKSQDYPKNSEPKRCSCGQRVGPMTFARQARLQREVVWHYINYLFKPEREPEHINPLPPHRENILTAIAENKLVVGESIEPEKRAIALTWLFHLVGDVHQPLHAIQLFTREYSNGDRGGNELCVRVAGDRAAIDLHRLGWIDYVDKQLGVSVQNRE